MTPLFAAWEGGHLEVVRLLLRARPELDAARGSGETPLFAACPRGHAKVVRLLRPGLDAGCPRTDGMTPLFAACRYGHHAVVRWPGRRSAQGIGTSGRRQNPSRNNPLK